MFVSFVAALFRLEFLVFKSLLKEFPPAWGSFPLLSMLLFLPLF